MNDLERLRAARAYLSDPERWNQRHYTSVGGKARCAMAAIDLAHQPARPHAEQPTIEGAPVKSIYMKLASQIPMDALRAFELSGPMRPEDHIMWFNDHLATHHDILAVFDRAIEAEEKRVASPSIVPALSDTAGYAAADSDALVVA